MSGGRSSAGMSAGIASCITTARTLIRDFRRDRADQRGKAGIDEQHAVTGMVDDVGDVVRATGAD